MKSHFFKTISNISNTDLELLMTDSKLNHLLFEKVRNLLQFDGLVSTTMIRVGHNYHCYFASSLSKEEIKKYLITNAWQYDPVLHPMTTATYEKIQYKQDSHGELGHEYSDMVRNRTSLVIERQHSTYKDSFSFDFPYDALHQCSFEDMTFLYKRLNDIINFLYKSLIFTLDVQLNSEELSQIDPDKAIKKKIIKSVKQQDILDAYQITLADLNYMRHIASGLTAKEIAQQASCSFRTVQHRIAKLNEIFQIESKSELETIAKIISSYQIKD